MAIQTTTFKGARYLVKFHDPIEWASTESYEAIEAVQHNAFTYISKQPVPAGVQIDNTDFWLLWADPNAQMEELRQLVAGYVEDVETLSGTVSGLSDGLSQEIENRKLDIEKAHVFETVADMKQNANLSVGAICHTSGFHTSGDGGAAWYKITDTGTANEMDVIACGELFANLIDNDGYANILKYGAKNDGSEDMSVIFNYLATNKDVFLPNGNYLTSNPLVAKHNVKGAGYSRKRNAENGTFIISNMQSGTILSFDIDDSQSYLISDFSIVCNSQEIGIDCKTNANNVSYYVENVSVFNVSNIGLNVGNNGTFASRGFYANNVCIWGNANYTQSKGVILSEYNGDNRIDNLEIMGCQIGIRAIGNIWYGDNWHIWCGCLAGVDSGAWWSRTHGIELSYGAKLAIGNLYLDTCYLGIVCGSSAGYFITVNIENFIYVEDTSNAGSSVTDGALFYNSGNPLPVINIANAILHGESTYKTKQFQATYANINSYSLITDVAFTSANWKTLLPGSGRNTFNYQVETNTLASSDTYNEFARIPIGQGSGGCNIKVETNSGEHSYDLNIVVNAAHTPTIKRTNYVGNEGVFYKVENGILKLYFSFGAAARTIIKYVQVINASNYIEPFNFGACDMSKISEPLEQLTSSAGLTPITAA